MRNELDDENNCYITRFQRSRVHIYTLREKLREKKKEGIKSKLWSFCYSRLDERSSIYIHAIFPTNQSIIPEETNQTEKKNHSRPPSTPPANQPTPLPNSPPSPSSSWPMRAHWLRLPCITIIRLPSYWVAPSPEFQFLTAFLGELGSRLFPPSIDRARGAGTAASAGQSTKAWPLETRFQFFPLPPNETLPCGKANTAEISAIHVGKKGGERDSGRGGGG